MGETEDAMQYDEELIFKHLYVTMYMVVNIFRPPFRCFYLDTVDNAVANSLTVKANKREDDIKQK